MIACLNHRHCLHPGLHEHPSRLFCRSEDKTCSLDASKGELQPCLPLINYKLTVYLIIDWVQSLPLLQPLAAPEREGRGSLDLLLNQKIRKRAVKEGRLELYLREMEFNSVKEALQEEMKMIIEVTRADTCEADSMARIFRYQYSVRSV